MDLISAIKKRNVSKIRKITKETSIAEAIELFKKLSVKDIVLFFRMLTTSQQSKLFANLDAKYQKLLINAFTEQEVKTIINELFSDEIADLIEEVPEEMAKKILKNTSPERRSDVNRILKYSDEQTGSIMSVDITTLNQSWTVQRAINFIKENKNVSDFYHYFFLVNNKGKLVGTIVTEDLIFTKNSEKLKNIKEPIAYVYTTTDKEEAAKIFARENRSALPVVNKQKEVIGAIASNDIIDVVQEAATEDIHKMAGIGFKNADKPYSEQKVLIIFKSRILWLFLLMISATISQIVLDAMQTVSNKFLQTTVTTAIVAILPVISGAAGNAGSQSSTTIIRALATNDIGKKKYFKSIWKEIKVSIIIGLVLGIVNFIRLIIYYAVREKTIGDESLFLSLAASVALFFVIVLAKLVGSLLPLLAVKMKIDPATMAAPLLTTLVDAFSIAIFFGIAIGIMYPIFH